MVRNSRPEVFFKKGVLENLAKFKEKHFCWSLFFNKVTGLRSATLFKKGIPTQVFLANFAKFLRTSFFTEQLQRLLLDGLF